MILAHFRLWENEGFKYFSATRQIFGLCSALEQVSPLFNTLRHLGSYIALWRWERKMKKRLPRG